MALARLALKNTQQKVLSSPSAAASSMLGRTAVSEKAIGGVQRQSWKNSELVKKFATAASDKASDEKSGESKEVSVSEGKKSRLFPRRQRNRDLWRNNDRDFVPALYEFFPSGLGNALMQATENINRLFENLNVSPWSLSGRVKEHDDSYKLRYDVPGLAKEDVKITVEDGVLTIRGEHKEEKEEESDDEFWSSRRYGYYNTSLSLPEDAKPDGIKA
ncbi:hypothetical protein FNV43_RR06971 [Rhamnella rubrinervis]|uniref:SHSP domain-containing protein n=1 Tax=Rhamnella rubrinervis TaxID=2594499 RepID=A0A8K0HE14_9ROSA|nr:hypothetical protein FNV43_RR06971 [Rhamnella rubrinervis]